MTGIVSISTATAIALSAFQSSTLFQSNELCSPRTNGIDSPITLDLGRTARVKACVSTGEGGAFLDNLDADGNEMGVVHIYGAKYHSLDSKTCWHGEVSKIVFRPIFGVFEDEVCVYVAIEAETDN